MNRESGNPGQDGAALALTFRTVWIVWGAMVGSVVVHAGIAFAFAGAASAGVDVGALTTPLVMTGFFMAMSGGLVFRRIHRDMPADPAPGQPRETADSARTRRAMVLSIVAWALFDGAAVVGLVLALLGGKGWPLIALGAGLLAIHPPRRSLFDPREAAGGLGQGPSL